MGNWECVQYSSQVTIIITSEKSVHIKYGEERINTYQPCSWWLLRSSRNFLRLHIISKRYDNPQRVLRSSKDLSAVIKISKEFLIVVIIIEGPRTKVKILVSNHNLKEDQFNKPKIYCGAQIEKSRHCFIYFSTDLDKSSESSAQSAFSGEVDGLADVVNYLERGF